MEISYVFFWLIITIVLAVIELATMGLLTIWFAVGAVVAMLISFLDVPFIAQFTVFLIVSICAMLVVRPWAAAHLNNKTKKTNVDALVGRKTIVKTDIDNIHGTGKVELDGSTWLATSTSDEIIKEGEEVVIKEVHGAKLVVEREVK
ncbi:Membrane protein implicated in regulation of membrane protease activity [Butyrivibrio sp. INlla18]|uniref:NfeD family protein n=1 Tax=Butyrivibrio sp. INlla18 TaxID=1520806 RepID=UPI00088B76E9|nr:NfeD family protein [Butyrivibrio sp. INlla18]SDA40150.1 Membrane protein implicated in regulation of membrane protease activity [Butyrivibrio sp. INlla18]